MTPEQDKQIAAQVARWRLEQTHGRTPRPMLPHELREFIAGLVDKIDEQDRWIADLEQQLYEAKGGTADDWTTSQEDTNNDA